MSIKVTKEIKNAIRSLIDNCGSALEVERKTKVSNVTIGRYLNGESPRMNDTTWAALEPYLRPYLNDTSVYAPGSTIGGINSTMYGAAIIGKAGKVVHQLPDGTNLEEAIEQAVKEFRRKAIDGVIDLEIDPVAQKQVLKFLKDLK